MTGEELAVNSLGGRALHWMDTKEGDIVLEQLYKYIPKLNHDVLIELGLWLSFDMKLNSRKIWR